MLKYLQPHREKASKDRSRRFAAGQLPGDKEANSDHDIYYMDYWLVIPSAALAKEARCFLLGQVIYMAVEEKVCHKACSNNPNLEVMLTVYCFDTVTECYSSKGRSGLLKAKKALLRKATVTDVEDGASVLITSELPDGYVPYHDDLDLHSRLTTPACNLQLEECSNEDPYIVEQVLDKRFRSGQYEFLVKWVGYTKEDCTWELAYNIPEQKMTEFEVQRSLCKDRPEGL